MPPKKAPSVSETPAMKNPSSRSVGAPRKPVSADPKIQARRDASQAKRDAKKASSTAPNSAAGSAASSAAGTGAKKRGRPPLSAKMGTATASGAATVPTFIINTGNNSSLQQLKERTAKSTLGRALKMKLARKELSELKQDKKFGDVDLDSLTTIQIPYRDAKKIFSKDIAMLKYINRVYKMENDGKAPDDISLVELEYRPFSTYDYYVIPYFDPAKKDDDEDEVAQLYRTKVPRSRDVNFSDYLYNKYITPPSNPNRKNYSASVGTGSIRGEGSSGAPSTNRSSVSSKSDAFSPVSDATTTRSSRSSRSSSSRKSKEEWVYDEDTDQLVKVGTRNSSSSSIGKSSSSGGSVAGSRRIS